MEGSSDLGGLVGPDCRSHLRAGPALQPSPALSAAVPRRTPACASRRSDDPNDPDRLDRGNYASDLADPYLWTYRRFFPAVVFGFGATTSASLADQAGTRLHGAQPQIACGAPQLKGEVMRLFCVRVVCLVAALLGMASASHSETGDGGLTWPTEAVRPETGRCPIRFGPGHRLSVA